MWEFGFGLSYTTFSFEVSSPKKLIVSTDAIVEHDQVYYQSKGEMKSPAGYDVKVTNTGNVNSECSVLGFVSSDHNDAPVNKELLDFARVGPLKPGESTIVHLSLPATVLSIVDKDGVQSILPGKYNVEFGVHGSAESVPATAQLILSGNSKEMFSFKSLKKQQQ